MGSGERKHMRAIAGDRAGAACGRGDGRYTSSPPLRHFVRLLEAL